MLKGTLDDFTLADMFRLMSLAKKTGRLDVTRRAGEGHVYFREGEVYYAESSLAKEPLGRKLVRARVLNENQLNKALDLHAQTGQRVGEILVGSGQVSIEQIEAAVQQQIQDAVFDLLRWDLGDFSWEGGAQLAVEVPIAVSVENLIIEAARRLDELEVITRKIPSVHAVLAMAPTPPEGAAEINITPDEWRLLVLVDGTRTVSEIGALGGLDDFEALRMLYGLLSTGLIELDHEATADAVALFEAEESGVGADPDEAVAEDEVAAEIAHEIPADDEVRPGAGAVETADDTAEPAAAEEPAALETPEPSAETPAEIALGPVAEADLDLALGGSSTNGRVESPVAEVAEPQDDETFESIVLEVVERAEDDPVAADADDYEVQAEAVVAEPDPDEDAYEEAAAEPATASDADDEPAIAEPTLAESAISAVGAEEAFEEALWGSTEPAPSDSPPEEWFADPDLGAAVAAAGETDDAADSFLGELLDDDASASDVATSETSASEAPGRPAPAGPGPASTAPAAPKPAATAPAGPGPAAPEPPAETDDGRTVDRAAVVRELAGLFDDDRPRNRPAGERPPAEPGDERKRVEDDDQINKGLVSRLIKGVKGL